MSNNFVNIKKNIKVDLEPLILENKIEFSYDSQLLIITFADDFQDNFLSLELLYVNQYLTINTHDCENITFRLIDKKPEYNIIILSTTERININVNKLKTLYFSPYSLRCTKKLNHLDINDVQIIRKYKKNGKLYLSFRIHDTSLKLIKKLKVFIKYKYKNTEFIVTNVAYEQTIKCEIPYENEDDSLYIKFAVEYIFKGKRYLSFYSKNIQIDLMNLEIVS